MKIGIANDHHGYKLKCKLRDYLEKKNYQVIDYGSDNEETVDYPDYAFKIGRGVAHKQIDYGILICGSGIGMSIACNRVAGARCAKVNNKKEAYLTRNDNNANVIAISGQLSFMQAKKIICTFINTKYSNLERHNRRLQKIDSYKTNEY